MSNDDVSGLANDHVISTATTGQPLVDQAKAYEAGFKKALKIIADHLEAKGFPNCGQAAAEVDVFMEE